MARKKETQPNIEGRGKKKLREKLRAYGRKPTNTYFLLWSTFCGFSLLLLLLLGVTQTVVMGRSFKEQAASSVSERGPRIERLISAGPPSAFNGDYRLYWRVLESENNVELAVMTENGTLLYPSKDALNKDDPDWGKYFNYTEEMERLKQMIGNGRNAVYEHNDSYVYGAKMSLSDGQTVYLYVGQSFALMKTATTAMSVRTVLVCVFGCVLSFAVSSAVAGWVTRPLLEITEKAGRFAAGDFEVDFHGENYSLEVSKLAETLNYARDELSKTDRMQKELIANVSHDFKTPLTMIKAYASMIVEISGNNPEKREKHAKVIIDEADRLTSLVTDVLNLSKLQAGIDVLKKERVDVSMMLQEILGRFAYLKETKGYHFETDVEDGLIADADGLKIGQVLYNLIGNAVNYTGEGKHVYVEMKRQGERFRFAVRDTGKGIKPEEINGIWDRYYRSSETHKRPVQGTGLGLSIVKNILDRHGLEYGVESEVGKGSTFYVWFYVAE